MNQLYFTALAPEAIQVGLCWEIAHGWRLRIAVRLSTSPWNEADVRDYDGLNSEEALDVLCLEMAQIFGVKD